MAKYFNTTLGSSMLPDGMIEIVTIAEDVAANYLLDPEVVNAANPSHANTLDAMSRRLGVDVRSAKGGRVSLEAGDSCLIVEIGNIPRETREFTDEEVAKATLMFRLVAVYGQGMK